MSALLTPAELDAAEKTALDAWQKDMRPELSMMVRKSVARAQLEKCQKVIASVSHHDLARALRGDGEWCTDAQKADRVKSALLAALSGEP